MPTPKPNKHTLEIAALAEVVRSVIQDLAQHGKVVSTATQAALAEVDRWLRGEVVTVEALLAVMAAAHEDGVPYAQREKDRALGWANTAAGNLAWCASRGRLSKEGLSTTMDAAVYALDSLGIPGIRDRAALERLRKQSLASVKPAKTTPPKSSAPKPVRVKKDALTPFIGAAASARLVALKARFEPASKGTPEDLAAALAHHGYPAHPAVLAFEERYGGLVVADGAGEEGMDWIYGAHACLASNAHVHPGGGEGEDALVPVAYAPNDVIYYLDGSGRAWVEDTIEDEAASLFADDGDAMVSQILRHQIAFEGRR